MAEGKKSFVAYCDWIDTFEALPDDKAGQLAKHLFRYVNDLEPESDDVLINAVFANLKRQLKRDLKTYEAICERNSLNGSKGGRPKKNNPNKAKKPTGLSGLNGKPKKADNDNDNDNDILKREFKFKDEIKDYKNLYNIEVLKAFFNYWSEPSVNKKKMRFEMQKTWDTKKRLVTWSNNSYDRK